MKGSLNRTDFCILFAGIFFSLIITIPFIFQSILFVFHIPMQVFIFPAMALAALVFCQYHLNRIVPKKFLAVWRVLIIALIACSYKLCLSWYDFSYDGMWYHQDGVRLIAQGWNPYEHYLSLAETSLSDIYLNHYPKAPWITGGSIYAFTQKLESAKIINWFALIASFCFAYCALKSVFRLNLFSLIVCSVLVAMNPVVICQLFTFYIDGLLGSLLVCLFPIIVLFHSQKEIRWLCILCGGTIILFCINIKFTALIYVLLFMSGHFVFVLMYQRSEWIKHLAGLAGVFLLGIVFLGWTSYMRNTIQYGHPFYPLMGNKNIGTQIANVPMPANFFDKNRFEQFYLATFAKAQWSRSPYESVTKKIFSKDFFIQEEYKRADPEMSGFGPLFAEVLLLISAGIIAVLLLNRRGVNWPYVLCVAVLGCSVMIIPLFWYARYAPQLWILVLLLSLAIYTKPVLRFWAYLVWLCLLVNCFFVAQQNISFRIQQTRVLDQQFDLLKRAKNPVIYGGWMESVRIRLKENNIMYQSTTRAYPQDSITFIPYLEASSAFYVNSTVQQ